MNEREIRVNDPEFAVHVREAGEGEPESRIVEGYAIVFDRESVVLCDWCEEFREIIRPEAVTQELLDTSDIKMNLWHKRERLIARRNCGKGTLEVGKDERGVWFRFEAPHTPDGDTCLELVKRGDLSGCSFAYTCNDKTDVEYIRGEKKNDPVVRIVKHIEALYDMTVCSDPAYQDTTVSAREAIEGINAPKETQKPDNAYMRDVEALKRKASKLFI